MATTFFTLPRELRIMVYDFAWKNIPLVQHCNNKYNWFAWYDIDSPMISSISVKHLLTQDDAQKFVYKLPFWLLASKQVLMEGVDMFHSNGKMSLQVEKNMDPTDFALPSVLSPLETRELHIFPAVHTIAGRNRFVEVFSDSHIESLMHGLSPKRRRISESSYSTSHVKKNEVTIEGYMLYHTTMAKQLQGMEGEWKSENSVVTAEEAPGLIFE